MRQKNVFYEGQRLIVRIKKYFECIIKLLSTFKNEIGEDLMDI